ncbi:hypothetical protein BJ684DRAFT_21329, partial [Piptocephalis cylindrospora]
MEGERLRVEKEKERQLMIERKEKEAQEQLSLLYEPKTKEVAPSWEDVGRLRGNLALKRSTMLMLDEQMRKVQDRHSWIQREVIRMSGELRAAQAEADQCQDIINGWRGQRQRMQQEVRGMVEEETSLVQSLMGKMIPEEMRMAMVEEEEEEEEEGEVGMARTRSPMEVEVASHEKALVRKNQDESMEEMKRKKLIIEAKRQEAILSLKRKAALNSLYRKSTEKRQRAPDASIRTSDQPALDKEKGLVSNDGVNESENKVLVVVAKSKRDDERTTEAEAVEESLER